VNRVGVTDDDESDLGWEVEDDDSVAVEDFVDAAVFDPPPSHPLTATTIAATPTATAVVQRDRRWERCDLRSSAASTVATYEREAR